MRMIPPYVRDTGSSAEHRVFQILQKLNLPDGWMGFHSLNLSRHQYKKWAEIDFLIVGPEGLFVLEVKGGGVACADGVWTFTDRFGEEHRRTEGPFDQAKTGMYALLDAMKAKLPRSLLDRLVSGWGVVFPDSDFIESSPEMPVEVVCDRRKIRRADGFKKYLHQLSSYWHVKAGNRVAFPVATSELEQIRHYVRPNFDVVPSLAARADNVEQEIVTLTTEQYRYLDAVEGAPRILCSGGAGTGKTFLAVEVARRELANNKRVLMVARGIVFTAYLRSRISGDGLIVASHRDLQRLLNQVSARVLYPFDVIVVDEGQDLMTMSDLQTMDGLLVNGLEHGRWRWFLDENSQSAIYDVWEEDAYGFLQSTSAVPMLLKRNCRNTEDIIFQTELATGARLGETVIRGRGMPVRIDVVNGVSEAASALGAQLERWMDEGVRPSEIVILSTVSFSDSSVSRLPLRWLKRIRSLTGSDASSVIDCDDMVFSTVMDYKGLERRFVALIDTESLDKGNTSLAILYVAMTRAHAGLWIGVDRGFEKDFNKLKKQHLELIMKRKKEQPNG